MRTTRNDRPYSATALCEVVVVSTLAVLAGCSDASSGAPSPGQTTTAGGGAGADGLPAMGGAAMLPANTGGSTAVVGGTSGTGGLGQPSSGGSTDGQSGAGAAGGAGNGGGGVSSGGMGGGMTGGGTAGTSTGLVIPPVRDTASKVPISAPPAGYTVEGNYAYGPLTAQRLDVIYPANGGPKATQTLPVVLMFHGGA